MPKTQASKGSPIWIDISGTSTVTGLTTPTIIIRYIMLSHTTMFLHYDLAGTGSGTTLSFTIPLVAKTGGGSQINFGRTTNNVTVALGSILIAAGASTINLGRTETGGTWSAGVARAAFGNMTLEVD